MDLDVNKPESKEKRKLEAPLKLRDTTLATKVSQKQNKKKKKENRKSKYHRQGEVAAESYLTLLVEGKRRTAEGRGRQIHT